MRHGEIQIRIGVLLFVVRCCHSLTSMTTTEARLRHCALYDDVVYRSESLADDSVTGRKETALILNDNKPIAVRVTPGRPAGGNVTYGRVNGSNILKSRPMSKGSLRQWTPVENEEEDEDDLCASLICEGSRKGMLPLFIVLDKRVLDGTICRLNTEDDDEDEDGDNDPVANIAVRQPFGVCRAGRCVSVNESRDITTGTRDTFHSSDSSAIKSRAAATRVASPTAAATTATTAGRAVEVPTGSRHASKTRAAKSAVVAGNNRDAASGRTTEAPWWGEGDGLHPVTPTIGLTRGPEHLSTKRGRKSARFETATTIRRPVFAPSPRRRPPPTPRPPGELFLRDVRTLVEEDDGGYAIAEGGRYGERGSETSGALSSGPVEDNQEISTTPSFITSIWGPCSVTCSTGIRTRRVHCRVLLESNGTILNLPDSNCPGTKPGESELCTMRDCVGSYGSQTAETYVWIFSGSFGPCSRSCAGGLQDPMFSCIRSSDYSLMKPDKCAKRPLPSTAPRMCNEQRCPPRWRVFPDGQCTAACGGGTQLRRVRCVYDALDRGGEMIAVEESLCNASQPAPQKTVLCNMSPCPPNWFIDTWSKCSVTCGVGVQTRQVRCEQKMTMARVETDIAPSFCAQHSPRPHTEQPCAGGDAPDGVPIPCDTETARPTSVINSESLTVIQLQPKNKIVLNAGSSAALIPGATVFMHCPVQPGFRQAITWSVGDKVVPEKGRIKNSKSGVVRIRMSREKDAAVYTCSVGNDTANVTISFHSLDDAAELVRERIEHLAEIGVRSNEQMDDGIDRTGWQDDNAVEQKEPFSMKQLLKKTSLTSLPLHYLPSAWTPCSRSCGGDGYQSRDIACHVTAHEYSLVVEDMYCDKKGLQKPIESRDCGFESCPKWRTGTWGECSDLECSSVGVGTRSRPLYCISANGSRINPSTCPSHSSPLSPEDDGLEPVTVPSAKESCSNDQCRATWKTSGWSKCSVSCGGRGSMSRAVHCVWVSSKASTSPLHCNITSRPSPTKPCFTLPCSQSHSPSAKGGRLTSCRDESHYCRMMPALRMCNYPQYRQQCCYSCSTPAAAAASRYSQQQQQLLLQQQLQQQQQRQRSLITAVATTLQPNLSQNI